jgi:molybdate transport system substrate-binding protein
MHSILSKRLQIYALTTLLSFLAAQIPAQAQNKSQTHDSSAIVGVAVATNFVTTLKSLKVDFESFNTSKLRISAGSTGKLYAQIRRGAPYDIFLAADQQRPKLLEQSGLTVAKSRFTYAGGGLVLWSPNRAQSSNTGNHESQATTQSIEHWLSSAPSIALANPRLAPYGFAAQEVLDNLKITLGVSQRRVTAENIGQTFALVATGNATLGFVAAAQMLEQEQPANTYLNIPKSMHSPIRQDAVQLKLGADNQAATDFMHYLASARAQKIISSAGFTTDLNPNEANLRP